MTDAPLGAPATPAAVPTVGPRPTPGTRPRRPSATELVAPFASAASAEALSAALADPKWLADERAAALESFDALPIESNVLYTT